MRRHLVLLPLVLLAGCASTPGDAPTASPVPVSSPTPAQVSCQPFGYAPVLVPFAYVIGPTTSAAAEQTAVAMLRACAGTPDESGVTVTIEQLTSGVQGGTGGPKSPNASQAVWTVEIDTMESTKGGEPWPAHYWIEVNQATGVPTLIAYG